MVNVKILFFGSTAIYPALAFTSISLLPSTSQTSITFKESHHISLSATSGKDPWAEYYNNNPSGTPPTHQQPSGVTNASNEEKNNNDDDDTTTLKASRFSKFAPDASLDTQDFRSQLKENMKADLERRRKEDPNRGNQPTRNYLAGL